MCAGRAPQISTAAPPSTRHAARHFGWSFRQRLQPPVRAANAQSRRQPHAILRYGSKRINWPGAIASYVSSGYRDAMGFLLIIAILLVKPTGLFARKERIG